MNGMLFHLTQRQQAVAVRAEQQQQQHVALTVDQGILNCSGSSCYQSHTQVERI
jgi:hypothetical protein